MQILTKKLYDDVTIPKITTDGAAGADLVSYYEYTIQPNETVLIKTALSMCIPPNHVGMVCSRSGLALKHSVFVLNAPGIIDSDYRGEIGVILHNGGKFEYKINVGDRVAQLLLIWALPMEFKEVNELPETSRGQNGFGSTGNK